MNHLGDTNKMVDDKTIIEWNADVGTRFLTIYPDGSFHINQNTPPLYALGELAKAFIKQQDRIKRLEEAGDALEYASVILEAGEDPNGFEKLLIAQRAWRKAKEAKP
jgi:hypothetical protein